MKDRLKEIIKVLNENNITEGMNPKKLCKILEELGPTFIKIGQILSTRIDLLPEDYIQELSKLRSKVLPLDFNIIKQILIDSYGNIDEYFKSIDEVPIGSASIAQVHVAYLKSGEKVVIKIKRPNVDETFKTDIRLLKEAVTYLHLNKFVKVMDLNLVLDDLYNTTLQELDFSNEVKNLIKFKDNNCNEENIDSPIVYTDLCTNNTIVMEYIDGLMINEISKLKVKGYSLKNIALALSENYIKQALDDGFFQADPHPDNIKKCMKAIIFSDYNEVARILIDMSTPKGEVDHLSLVNDIKNILLNFGSTALNDIDVTKFIKEMFLMLQKNKLVLDNDVTMLIRGISIIEGVLEEIDPNINLVEVLTNKIEKDNLKEISSLDNIKKISKNVINSADGLVKLPGEVSNLITSINNGEIKFKVEFSDSKNHIDKLEKLLHELIIAFIDGILIVCFCFSQPGRQKVILFFGIVILSVWLIIKMLYDHIHKGY